MTCTTFATMEELALALLRVAADGTIYVNTINVAIGAGTSDPYITCDNNAISFADAFAAALTEDADGNLALNVGTIT